MSYEPAEAYYLAIDPGETTGWATFNQEGKPQQFDKVKGREAVYVLLQSVQPTVLIVEDFNLFPWKARDQAFSSFEAVRVIGAIELWAWAKGATVVLQKPNIKSIGYKWAGLPTATQHKDSHERDAYVHGVYYLQSNGILKPQQLRRN